PIFLADWLCRPGRWLGASMAVGGCIFLVLTDGSRTGTLILVATLLFAMAGVAMRRDWKLILMHPWGPVLAAGFLLFLLFLNSGLNIWRDYPDGITWQNIISSLFGNAFSAVVDNRLGAGDAPRMRLLFNGIT